MNLQSNIKRFANWWWRLSEDTRMVYALMLFMAIIFIGSIVVTMFSRFSCF